MEENVMKAGFPQTLSWSFEVTVENEAELLEWIQLGKGFFKGTELTKTRPEISLMENCYDSGPESCGSRTIYCSKDGPNGYPVVVKSVCTRMKQTVICPGKPPRVERWEECSGDCG